MTGMYEQYYLVFGGEGYTPIKQAGQNGFHTSGALKLEELCPSGWWDLQFQWRNVFRGSRDILVRYAEVN